MQFKSFSILALASAAASLVSAESAKFSLLNIRSASQFQYSTWSDLDGSAVVLFDSDDVSATKIPYYVFEEDTSIKTANGTYLHVNSDFSVSYVDDKSQATTGFTTASGSDSLFPLLYNGAESFEVCGSDNVWTIFAQQHASNAAQGLTCYGLRVDVSYE